MISKEAELNLTVVFAASEARFLPFEPLMRAGSSVIPYWLLTFIAFTVPWFDPAASLPSSGEKSWQVNGFAGVAAVAAPLPRETMTLGFCPRLLVGL